MKNKKLKKASMSTQSNNKRYMLLIGLVILFFVVFYSFTVPYFLTFATVINLIRQSTVLVMLAIGMTFVMISGQIDLSVGSNIAITGVITALIINLTGQSTALAAIMGIITALIFATLFGCLNGYLVGYLKINAFMATLAMLTIGRGLTLLITGGTRIVVNNKYFNYIGNSNLNIFGLKLPAMILMVIPIIIFSLFLLKNSTFGRKTYAIGGNDKAALASGINVKMQTVLVFAYLGLMCGFGTIITMGRAASAQPLAGYGIEFDVITAVVLGGVSLSGAIGTTQGALMGSLLISVLFLGINMIDIPIYFNNIIKGFAILVAIFINDLKFNKSSIRVNYKKYDIKEIETYEQNVEPQILTLKNVSKHFPGVQALDDVTFQIKRGMVHALTGENGAGKSTLIKILSGVYQMDGGEILIDNKVVNIKSPSDAQKIGISVIYQEFALIPELDIAQNVFLGKELSLKFKPLLAIKKMREDAAKLLMKFGLKIKMGNKINMLTVGRRQMVEIAKAVGSNSWIVVMDEPTSAISESEKQVLFDIIKELKSLGIAVIYISHKLQEIFDIADEVTVLRDGKHVITLPINELDESKLIKYMVNRELKDMFLRNKTNIIGDEVLRVENLCKDGVFEPISFTVNAGEVLGIAGLIGAGRTEIMRCIFGLDKYDGGSIFLNSKKIDIKSPGMSIKNGICYVSEDRRGEGIIPLMNVKSNITLTVLDEISKMGWINAEAENFISKEYIKKLDIKTPSDLQLIYYLSGGNQQKICLAKMLAKKPNVLILDEPTRGIDVGAKNEIYKLIEILSQSGIAIIMISSELPEIIGISDRILVLSEGRLTAEIFENENGFNQENIMAHATS